MRRKGCSELAILAALRIENTARCEPPLDDEEIATIARSVSRYAPAPEPATLARRVRAGGFVEFVDGKAVAR
jgi:putative DNA primase/helicase